MYRTALLTIAKNRNHFIRYRQSLTTVVFTRGVLLNASRFRDVRFIGIRCLSSEKTKLEETLRMLKDDLHMQEAMERARARDMEPKNAPKLPLKTRVWNECVHYYHGFRLLMLETILSSRYLWRLVTGHALTRRERHQLVRTVSDLFRLVPFSVFIIVPFLELTLPIFLKLFPNMLPSTFQESSKEDQKLRRQLKVKLEMAKFLQDTLSEMALEKKSVKGDGVPSKAAEFAEFMEKARKEGGYVSSTDLFKYVQLFEDELTLDNLNMSQLRALCRMLGIQPFGTAEMLRFQLILKLRELKNDDKQIALEGGVDSLTIPDLQLACRARGMRSLGMSERRLKDQLNQWLELSLNDNVPPSLLLLSRALYLSESVSFKDRLKKLIAELPEGITEQTRMKLLELEGAKLDFKARLAMIKAIEDELRKERKAEKARKLAEEKAVLAKKQAEEALAKSMADSAVDSVDVKETKAGSAVKLLKKLVGKEAPSADVPQMKETLVADAAETMDMTKDELKVDDKDLRAIGDVLSSEADIEAKSAVSELKEKAVERTEDLREVDALDEHLVETKGAKRVQKKVDQLIENAGLLITELEEKKRQAKETIADPAAKGEKETKVGMVHVGNLMKALKQLRSAESLEEKEVIAKVVHAIDGDKDSLVDISVVMQVIDLICEHKNVEVTEFQIREIMKLLENGNDLDVVLAFFDGKCDLPPSSSTASDLPDSASSLSTSPNDPKPFEPGSPTSSSGSGTGIPSESRLLNAENLERQRSGQQPLTKR